MSQTRSLSTSLEPTILSTALQCGSTCTYLLLTTSELAFILGSPFYAILCGIVSTWEEIASTSPSHHWPLLRYEQLQQTLWTLSNMEELNNFPKLGLCAFPPCLQSKTRLVGWSCSSSPSSLLAFDSCQISLLCVPLSSTHEACSGDVLEAVYHSLTHSLALKWERTK